VAKERLLVQTFVELADTLVADFDVVDFLHTLADRCAELFEAAEAGVMLEDQGGGLRVVSSSSERARLLELFELQKQQGPCLDCFLSGRPVNAEDLMDDRGRWPLFTDEAIAAGFRAAHSLPLRFRDQVIGALGLFRAQPGLLDENDLAAAQGMADIATISILQEEALRESKILAEQLQRALNSRIVIEQAKGALAERAHVNVDDAFNMLRTYARNHSRRLYDVSAELIANLITVEEVGTSRRTGEAGGSGRRLGITTKSASRAPE
jgi:GAF domain-containing protein